MISGDRFNHSGKLRTCFTCLEYIDKFTSSSSQSSETNIPLEGDQTPMPVRAAEQLPVVTPELDSGVHRPIPPMLAIPTTRSGENADVAQIVPARVRARAPTLDGTNPLQRLSWHGGQPRSANGSISYISDQDIPLDSDESGSRDSDENSSNQEDEQTMKLYSVLYASKSEAELPRTVARRRTSAGSLTRRPSFRRPPSGLGHHTSTGSKAIMRIGTRKHSAYQQGTPDERKKKRDSSKSRHEKVVDVPSDHVDHQLPADVIDLNRASIAHAREFLNQLLTDVELSTNIWHDTLMRPLMVCVETIDLDVRKGDSIDIRHYVKLKKIPGGTVSSTQYLSGAVFSKNIALKSMPQSVDYPRILLLNFPLEYSRNERFMSLDPILSQEYEYLRKLVARIVALGPTVIVSGSLVSGIAAKLLANEGIVVVTHVKESTLSRLSRYTGVDIVTSIDRLATDPRLGSCEKFEVKTFKYGDVIKTFLFFSGSPPKLGCTILLRGADVLTLGKVKDVVEFMVYVLFNLRLETALMRDQFVTLPTNDYVVRHDDDIPEQYRESDYFRDLILPELDKILSSSPLVNYGCPFLLKQARKSATQLVELNSRDTESVDESSETVAVNLEKLDFGGVVAVKRKDRTVTEGEKSSTVSDLVVIDLVPISDSTGHLRQETWLPGSFKTGSKIMALLEEERKNSIRRQWKEQTRQWELAYSATPYMLSPSSHQSIFVLFSSVCTETRTPCVGPDQLAVDFYTDSDMTLGQYVETMCFSAGEMCDDACGYTLKEHYRSYVHGNGRLVVTIENLRSKLPGLQDQILTWSHCKVCDTTLPVLPLSASSWKYSFGKYLELYFWSEKVSPRAGMCPHNIYRDHIRYFGFHDMAVVFEWNPVDLLRIIAPKPKMRWKSEHLVGYKFKSYFSIENKIHALWDSVLNRLKRIVVEGVALDKMEECQARITELTMRAEKEKSDTLESLKTIFCESSITDILCLNQVIRVMHEEAVKWDQEFIEFERSFFPSEKDIARITAQQLRKIFLTDETDQTPLLEDKQAVDYLAEKLLSPEEEKTDEGALEKSDVLQEAPAEPEPLQPSDSADQPEEELKPESDTNQPATTPANKVMEKVRQIETGSLPRIHSNLDVLRRPSFPARGSSIPTLKTLPSSSNDASEPSSKLGDNPSFGRFRTRDLERKLLQGKLGKLGKNSTRVSSLAKHFDQLSMEFEKERARERKLLSEGRFRASPVVQSRPVVEVYKNVEEAVSDTSGAVATSTDKVAPVTPGSTVRPNVTAQERVSDEEPLNIRKMPESVARSISDAAIAGSSTTTLPKDVVIAQAPLLVKSSSESAVTTASPPGNEATAESLESSQEREASDLRHATVDRQSLLHTLTSFWADRTATGWSPLDYPLAQSEHMFTDSDVIVREDEPSSLIAFCISSFDYSERMKDMMELPDNDPDTDSGPLEKWMVKKTGVHLKYDFEQGPAKLSCKIFFSEQFEAFRRQCGCDKFYIQSLARCVKWDSRGGKSGSAFLKTLDDRLIVKQLSPTELDAFVTFAPSYFEYMAKAFFHDLPTVLAKIFGFYQIRVKNPITGNVIRLDLIVMENLFYKRKMSRIFDLKGSMRNRHVQQTGREDEVLLDENMVEYIYESPLFVREHSKRFLRTSLYNDTLFLAKMNVMDYSLVIGIDEERKALVVGIIDFIRTFTWDKKLESWVKERGGLVRGNIKEPTVVSPRQYKNRFREAMERYILMVPDCWYQDA